MTRTDEDSTLWAKLFLAFIDYNPAMPTDVACDLADYALHEYRKRFAMPDPNAVVAAAGATS